MIRIAYHRYGTKQFSHSTISEHLAFTHQFVSDSTVANAILDRMVHTAHRLELKGESLRKK